MMSRVTNSSPPSIYSKDSVGLQGGHLLQLVLMPSQIQEFRTWLIEEKMVSHELLSKEMTKRHFKE
jgi:hypothetical protein